MKSSIFFYLLAAGLAFGFYQAPAGAISLGFQPAVQSVNGGDSLVVDVVISGLDAANEIASAYDLDVTYNASILTATGVTFSTQLGDLASFEADAGAVLTSGRIDFWEVSYLSDSQLALQQPDSFSLATLSFQALGVGNTSLLFDPNTPPGIDVKGLLANRLNLDVGTASVTVTSNPTPVPSPPTFWLCLLGLGALVKRLSS
jgi:hypothetical protein